MSDAPVTVMRAEDLVAEPEITPRIERGLPRRRRLTGVAMMAAGLPLLTLGLDHSRGNLALSSIVLLFLLAVLVLALVGGVVVGVTSALVCAWIINYFFIAPLHTLDIAQRDEEIALFVFVAVGASVSVLVELAGRRLRDTARAISEAETLSALAGGPLVAGESLTLLLDRARRALGMDSVELKHLDRTTGRWETVERAGLDAPESAPLRFDVPAGARLRLLGRGPAAFAQDQRVVGAFAAAAQTAFEGGRLSEEARHGREMETVDRQRTALLAAVGHDLRTPLASIKAATTSLRQAEIELTAGDRDELLATVEDSADRLDAVVANLLDASRLRAGTVVAHPTAVALDEVLGAALLAVAGAGERIVVDVAEDLPMLLADPGLLERVLVNVLDNALRHGAGAPVRVSAQATDSTARIAVIDEGPGVPAGERAQLFVPFQRLGDSDTRSGVGLGLSVARGFMEAMDGAIVADSSERQGLTIRLRLPLAAARR
jgi:two-component system sensor histidine kinase KdpD